MHEWVMMVRVRESYCRAPPPTCYLFRWCVYSDFTWCAQACPTMCPVQPKNQRRICSSQREKVRYHFTTPLRVHTTHSHGMGFDGKNSSECVCAPVLVPCLYIVQPCFLLAVFRVANIFTSRLGQLAGFASHASRALNAAHPSLVRKRK